MRLRAIGSIVVGIILMFTSTATTGRQRRAADEGAAAAPMSLIRGATFEMGTDAAKIPFYKEEFNARRDELFTAEVPRHTVRLGSFYLDRHEVTNARFARFLVRHPAWRKGRIPAELHNGNYLKHWDGDEYPQGKGEHPVVNVSWYAAVAFCRAEGKRLPTEAEWEYAARGGLKAAAFPWGDEMPDKTRANFFGSGIGGTTAVGSYPANGYGLFDMAGNVWEYLADEWGSYAASPQLDPVAGGKLFTDESYRRVTTRRVIRGGSWGGAPVNLRVAYRDSHPPDGARDFVGFRCAKSAPTKTKRRR